MARAYTPGLTVSPRLTYRARRLLPILGTVRKAVGDLVAPDDILAETSMLGDAVPVNLARLLSAPPADVPECLLVPVGGTVEPGQPLARTKGLFGLFRTNVVSQWKGTIESVSPVTGQLIVRGDPIPVQVRAYVSGRVVEVIPQEGAVVECSAALIQGIFGIGGETTGRIDVVCAAHDEPLAADLILDRHRGAILVGGSRVTDEALRKAVRVGASAIVCGGIDDQDLKEFLGYDLGVAITGSEKVGLTLVITEGFGDIAMAERTYKLLRAHQGAVASVNGATQIRAGVMRPEIVIPLAEGAPDSHAAPVMELALGVPVRIIRDPHFGVLGTVHALPHEPQWLQSGSKARVLEVRLPSGELLTVPRANVELIEG